MTRDYAKTERKEETRPVEVILGSLVFLFLIFSPAIVNLFYK